MISWNSGIIVYSLPKTWDNKQSGWNTEVEGGHKNEVENGARGTGSSLSFHLKHGPDPS